MEAEVAVVGGGTAGAGRLFVGETEEYLGSTVLVLRAP